MVTGPSGSRRYQMTAWCGAPSAPVVARLAKCGSSRNARTRSVSVTGSELGIGAMVRGNESAPGWGRDAHRVGWRSRAQEGTGDERQTSVFFEPTQLEV